MTFRGEAGGLVSDGNLADPTVAPPQEGPMQKMPRSSRSRYSTQPIYRSSMQKSLARSGLPFGGFVNVPSSLTPLPRITAPSERAKGTSISSPQREVDASSEGSANRDRPPAGLLVAALVAVSVVGCASKGGAGGTNAGTSSALAQANAREGCITSRAALVSRSGSKVQGDLLFEQCGTTLTITGLVTGLTPNQLHGFHVHENGDCSAPDASSAGGHYDPDGKPHGAARSVQVQTHAGDFGNLPADANGNSKVTIITTERTLRSGPLSLDGRAVVVHAKPDDLRTQPSGDSGARVACGVVTAR